ncbi:MAG: hypothetical protein NTZ09_04190, partial [Candidatus Hydrogenedentes bacterium]|nr:hypothetical protein [Candidatus Hydrogenedentota bacterium]
AIGAIAVLVGGHKKRKAKLLEGAYASVDAARAVLQSHGFVLESWPGATREVWHDKNFRNQLLVTPRPDGTATVNGYQ